MRYELIDGDTDIINALIKDNWTIENTFPNPYPQPYFFALMRLNVVGEDDYDLGATVERVRKMQQSRISHELPFQRNQPMTKQE